MSVFADRLYPLDQPQNSLQNLPSILENSSESSSPIPPLPDPSSRLPQSPFSSKDVGQQSCYWALLSADLQFIYLGPVLQLHLQEQASQLVGKSLLQFVHPDEQATAQRDLGGVLQSKTLHGSITRVRFARLYHIRHRLGHDGPPASNDKLVADPNFLATDIVINWAAEGLVLCFIHATNDESSWAQNLCGTPVLAQEQLQSLSRSLLMCAPESSHGRVFQIMANASARPLLLTWPPSQDTSSNKDIADLAKSVDLSAIGSSSSQARTNCTRRFKALRELHGTQVESVYIPHGSVIFACHKLQSSGTSSPSSAVRSQSSSNTTNSSSIPNNSFMGYNGASSTSYSLPPPPPHQSYYDQQYSLPPLSSSSSTLPPPTSSFSFSSAQPTLPVSNQYGYGHWNPSSHLSVQSLRSGYWNSHGSASYENGSSVPSSLPLSGGHQSHGTYGRPLSPYDSHVPYSSTTSNNVATSHLNGLHGDTPSPTSATSSVADLVPPPRRRVSPGSSRDFRENNGVTGSRERSHSNRPSGLLRCSSCKTTTSPEWRKGPSGKKELCNACGLRYARSRAKKEGHVVSSGGRKRKDKAAKRDSATPPSASSTAGSVASSYSASGVIPYHSSSTSSYPSAGSLRRTYAPNYDDVGSFTSSGNDIYGAARSAGTPSPSPPAGPASAGGGYPHYVSAPSDSVAHAPHSAGHHQGRTSYYGSSISSPLAANPPMLQTQSFERDHRDREGLPPTPVSAEPRTSYYEASYNRVERKDPPRGYERDYERDYEREGRPRSMVTG
ncbi:hypothetical protein GYMLUDRAFT_259868 [Collybiopsis luxurians FD-317 M1]|uniref:GATA-type domain-containing protein n=1 Tax=Collybiopsis luxurians FD-317 M1 TaxID=944289 RepID=A0A0D0D1R0_9AGAR|nr:hypothetical protein GYMLUDRAFT_259868 [Collybiopsis luxurians FD-317 M1]